MLKLLLIHGADTNLKSVKSYEEFYVKDVIYILDTYSKSGWLQSPITCPVASCFVAALDHKQKVHILQSNGRGNKHFSIAVNKLVPELGKNTL